MAKNEIYGDSIVRNDVIANDFDMQELGDYDHEIFKNVKRMTRVQNVRTCNTIKNDKVRISSLKKKNSKRGLEYAGKGKMPKYYIHICGARKKRVGRAKIRYRAAHRDYNKTSNNNFINFNIMKKKCYIHIPNTSEKILSKN